MKNWLKFFAVFFVILAVVLTALITLKANKPYYDAKKQAEKIVLQEDLLSNVTSSYVYSGKNAYVTIIGENEKNEKTAVFVPESDMTAKKEQVNLASGITEKEAVKAATKGYKVKKLLHAKLGVEKPGVVWEVAFKNDEDQMNYVYVLFENGQWWKKITNL